MRNTEKLAERLFAYALNRARSRLPVLDLSRGIHTPASKLAVFLPQSKYEPEYGRGAFLTMTDGHDMIDGNGSYSSLPFGHRLDLYKEEFEKIAAGVSRPVVPKYFRDEAAQEAMDIICRKVANEHKIDPDSLKGFFLVTGTEGTENAVRLARIDAQLVRGINPEKMIIGSCSGAFHGRSTGAANLGDDSTPRRKIGVPIIEGFRRIEWNNPESANEFFKVYGSRVACVILEVMQGEGGVKGGFRPASRDFVEAVRKGCDENAALLIFDEVQTGVHRTGPFCASKHYGVSPDLIVFAKGLSGGIFPASAIVGRKDVIAHYEVPGTYNSTFSQHPHGIAIIRKTLQLMEELGIERNVEVLSPFIASQMEELQKRFGFIEQVRSLGFMSAIEFKDGVNVPEVIDILQKHGLLTGSCGGNSIRFAPPLNSDKELLKIAFKRFESALQEVEKRTEISTLPSVLEERPSTAASFADGERSFLAGRGL